MVADRHVPRVRIWTDAPAVRGRMTTGRHTRVEVDGVDWPTFGYKIEGRVDDIQRVTLEFAADVTVERPEPVE